MTDIHNPDGSLTREGSFFKKEATGVLEPLIRKALTEHGFLPSEVEYIISQLTLTLIEKHQPQLTIVSSKKVKYIEEIEF